MVTTLISDTLLDPSKEINTLYKSQNASDFVRLVEGRFKDILSPHDAFYQIPPLNASYPPPLHVKRRVVRFLGMIQDTSASPDVYLTSLDDGTCGGWGIYEHSERSRCGEQEYPTIDYSRLGERESTWAVTVPGETPWARDRFNGSEFPMPKEEITYVCPKQYKNPSDDPGSFGVSLKFYEGGSNSPKPGEVKVFVGILDEEDIDDYNLEEGKVVPTVHVLFTLTTAVLEPWNMGTLWNALPEQNKDVRAELIGWIADEGLGGDISAATWLLLMILGRVQSRSPPLLPLSITISSFPDAPQDTSSSPALIWVLRELLSTLAVVPLSLEGINGKSFAPSSAEDDLHAGVLQQAPGTTTIVTETGIKEGKVTESGLKNLDMLQTAITTQTINYVFPFNTYSFPIDGNFVVVARGRKGALLKTDIVVGLSSTVADEELPKQLYKPQGGIAMPTQTKLEAFRDYVLAARRIRVTLAEGVGKYIEDEFVRLRRESSAALSSEDLARRMALAKLLSASLLEGTMSKETWTAAGIMDQKAKKL